MITGNEHAMQQFIGNYFVPVQTVEIQKVETPTNWKNCERCNQNRLTWVLCIHATNVAKMENGGEIGQRTREVTCESSQSCKRTKKRLKEIHRKQSFTKCNKLVNHNTSWNVMIWNTSVSTIFISKLLKLIKKTFENNMITPCGIISFGNCQR